jgi:hypothetical protein
MRAYQADYFQFNRGLKRKTTKSETSSIPFRRVPGLIAASSFEPTTSKPASKVAG